MADALDFLAHVRSESARFAGALEAADPSAPVPTCPDWTASDLLWHLTEVQAFWATLVEQRLTEPEAPGTAAAAEPDRPDRFDELHALFAATTDRLVDAFTATPAEAEVWTWSAERTAGFILRRQAHEALIHRRDAESVTGSFGPIDAELAADGIDEALRIMFGDRDAPEVIALGEQTCRIETTDRPAAWSLRFGRVLSDDTDGFVVTEDAGPTDEDAIVRGGAADLDLWVWSRGDADLTVEGDGTVFERLARYIARGID